MAFSENNYLPVPKPRKALSELTEIGLPDELPESGFLELVISTENQDLNLREFAAYLSFLDKSFGRISGDLRSYAQRRDDQVKVSFENGSLEAIIEAAIQNKELISYLIALKYLLKFLPQATKNFTSAYKDYQEASLTKLQRKELREKIKTDDELKKLDRRRINQLVEYFDSIYQRESRLLSRAKRFTLHHIKKIYFRIKNDNS